MRILCIAKDSHILSTKNNSVFAYVVGSCLNDDIKLMKFWNNWAVYKINVLNPLISQSGSYIYCLIQSTDPVSF